MFAKDDATLAATGQTFDAVRKHRLSLVEGSAAFKPERSAPARPADVPTDASEEVALAADAPPLNGSDSGIVCWIPASHPVSVARGEAELPGSPQATVPSLPTTPKVEDAA